MRCCDDVQSMKSTIEVELIGNDAKSHALGSLIRCLLSQNAKAFPSTILKSDTDTMKPPILVKLQSQNLFEPQTPCSQNQIQKCKKKTFVLTPIQSLKSEKEQKLFQGAFQNPIVIQKNQQNEKRVFLKNRRRKSGETKKIPCSEAMWCRAVCDNVRSDTDM